jgi:hypothetical protein
MGTREPMNMETGLTPLQARVVFHQERIFRSAGGSGMLAHQSYVVACHSASLPDHIELWDNAQCVLGLRLIEESARAWRMHIFRNVSTQWQSLERVL